MDVGIKGSNNEPQGTNKMPRNDRELASFDVKRSRLSKRLAATADCNDPMKFSKVSSIDQQAALPRRHVRVITAPALSERVR